MDRKGTWIIAASLFAGFIFCGLSYVFAQRGDADARASSGQVGRYQVVRSNNDVTIIIDTTTGDLYNAVPSDIKPFNARPRSDARLGGIMEGGKGGMGMMGGSKGGMGMMGGSKGAPGFKEDVERKFKDARRPMKDDFFPKEGKAAELPKDAEKK